MQGIIMSRIRSPYFCQFARISERLKPSDCFAFYGTAEAVAYKDSLSPGGSLAGTLACLANGNAVFPEIFA
jgi:hypothetical protein